MPRIRSHSRPVVSAPEPWRLAPSDSAFYFGSSWTADQLAASGFKGHALSNGGRPIPWSDDYATRIRQSGRFIERTRFVTIPHPNPDVDGETVNVWQVVETLAPIAKES